MKNDTPLTKDDLLETLAKFYSVQIKPDLLNFEKRIKEDLGSKINSVETDVKEIKNEVRWLKDEVKGKKRNCLTVSKKEFNQLKTRFDRYHPSN